MANKKISALTASTTPLAGTEVLPIVQGGATVKVAVSDLTAGRATSVLSLTSTNDSTVNGLAVGKGGGSVSSNTALGVSALAGNSTGIRMTAVGNRSMVGATGNFNAAFGSNAFESLTSGTNGTAIGDYALQQTTGSFNTAVGNGSGYLITTGSKNTILGIYSGNQNGLNITTSSNYVVLSDGDGTPRAYHNGTDWVYPTGNLVIGTSGAGIDFSATSGSGTSELLADYEEGTWTPSQGAGLTVVGTFSSSGTYTKVGRLVTLRGFVNATTSLALAANDSVICGNIPFTPAGTTADRGIGGMTNQTQTNFGAVAAIGSVTNIYNTGTIAATTTIHFTVIYFV
jgi:hypothetical protein